MKDFYRALGLEPYSIPAEVIRRATAALHDAETASVASHILLDERRKRVYDRTHAVLSSVGQLRANLGMLSGTCWELSDASDFEVMPQPGPSELKRLEKTKQTKLLRENLAALKGIGIAALAVTVIAAAILSGNDHDKQLDSTSGEERTPVKDVVEVNEPSSEHFVDSPPTFSVDGDITGNLALDESKIGHVVGKPTVEPVPVPLPDTGEADWSVGYSSWGADIPFRVVTPKGQEHYLIKLTDSWTGREVARFFIRAGDVLETKMPAGRFNLRYAFGERWYGHDLLFGPYTRCAKADDTFTFYKTSVKAIGNSIELIKQLNGNLETTPIALDDF